MTIVDIDTPFKGITITKSEGKHGTDDVIEHFGKGCEICMGFTFRAPEEKKFILLEIQFGQKILKQLLKNMNLIIL